MSMIHKFGPIVARVLLGLPFVVFGLNGFLQFIPLPPYEGAAGTFMGGLAAAGYFFPLLKATEIVVGVSLLSGRFVPLALTVLAPITLNIFAFHAVTAGAGIGLPIFLLALQFYLAWAYRDSFRALLNVNAKPTHPAAKAAAIEAKAQASSV
ncbi:MAG: DoxX family protein [Myxococcota bacterium]